MIQKLINIKYINNLYKHKRITFSYKLNSKAARYYGMINKENFQKKTSHI